jgi:DNA polymerase-3 subunit delta'
MSNDLTPRTATSLFGHEAAEAALMRDLAAGKLAHGWIISGPQGIGKATFAYRFARALLAGEGTMAIDADHAVFKRVAAQSHADLLVLEQAYDAKKEEHAREISVEQARGIGQFLSLTPGESQWRIVIIDAADALNANAANAILKLLEEPPPQAVLLLVSHNPGKLLPTIRSRCRMLRLAPLQPPDFMKVMRHIASGLEDEQCETLAGLAHHSPGVALKLYGQGALEMYDQLIALMASLPQLDHKKIHALGERIGSGSAHSNWQVFTHLALNLLQRIGAYASGAPHPPVSLAEEALWRNMAALHPAVVWADKWHHAASQFLLAERLHLDYKQVAIAFFHSLPRQDEFNISA